jgi:hypothetical protein
VEVGTKRQVELPFAVFRSAGEQPDSNAAMKFKAWATGQASVILSVVRIPQPEGIDAETTDKFAMRGCRSFRKARRKRS